MKMDLKMKGTDKVLRNINTQVKAVKNHSMKGLIESAIIIRRSMDKEEPLVPVGITGNLRSSWFTTPLHPQIALRVGFNANYAVFVHENMEAKNWGRKGKAGPKFLEKAFERNQKKVIQTIAEANKL
jgi:HK97 gp10 family phage protein